MTSSCEPETPCVMKVTKPSHTICNGIGDESIQLPQDICGVLGEFDAEFNMHVFLPDLQQRCSINPWMWISKRDCIHLVVAFSCPEAAPKEVEGISAQLVEGAVRSRQPKSSNRADKKKQQLARRAAKVMM